MASSSQDDEKKPESSHPEKGRGMKHEILYDSQFDDGFKVPPELLSIVLRLHLLEKWMLEQKTAHM